MNTYIMNERLRGEIDEADLFDSKYRGFINACFNYSKYFSLTITIHEEEDILEFRPYLIHSEFTNEWPGTIIGNIYTPMPDGGFTTKPARCKFCVYSCTPETKELLLSFTNLFYWYKDTIPIDIAFYRENKSLLMATTAHEGECYLYLENENINDFLLFAEWTIKNIQPFPQKFF